MPDNDSQTVQRTNEPWSGVQGPLKRGYAEAERLFNQGPMTYYPGQTFVGADPLEHMANESRLSYAQNQLPGQISAAQRAQSSMLNAPSIDNNPYVQNLAQRANQRIGRDFNETVMPALRSQGIQAQNLGGSRGEIAKGIAAGRAADAMADTTAKLYSDSYNAGLNQQARGLALAPQTMNLGFQPAQTMANAGQFLRNEKELALADDLARYNFEQERDYDNLGRYLGSLQGGLKFSNSTATGTGGGSRFGQAMGGGLLGYSLGGTGKDAMFSPTMGALGGGLLGYLG